MEAGEMTDAAAILDRLAPDPTTPYTPIDAAHRLLFFGVEPTIRALIDGIQSADRHIAILSLDVLRWIVAEGHFGNKPLKALSAAVDALGHSDRLVRVSAIDAVREFGESAAAAVPSLLRIARADEELLRVTAAAAVIEVSQAHGDEMRSILEAATDSGSPMVAHVARESLRDFDN